MLYQGIDLDSIFDSDSDFDQTRAKDAIERIKAVGLDFTSSLVDHSDISRCDRHTRRDIQEARYAAKCLIAKASDKGYAFWQVFEAVYGWSLSQNAWTGELMLEGYSQPTNPNKLLNELESALGLLSKLTEAQFDRKLAGLLEHRQFSPVQRYLYKLPTLTPNDWSDWNKLAEILFGTTDPQHQVKLSRWLIGAVARAMNPGCKMDSALVLRGKQGIGKTSFLQALFGEHFRTLHSHQSMLEQQRGIQQAWGCELGELEATFRAKDISALKAFLTETHDSFRDLNKELGAARPRHCVFAGTTNETAFLNDSTGSRRFWVIDSLHRIPVEWVKANRDKIWAVAYHLWASGEQWWLTDEEAELSELSNKAYQTENSYEEPLRTALDILEDIHGAIAIKAADVAKYFLDIRPENMKRNSRELAAAMDSLGYVRKNFSNKQLKGWHYVKPEATDPTPFDLKMVDEVLTVRANSAANPARARANRL